jgi:hypothetical protein
MPRPVENLQKMDAHLKQVVEALHGAVKEGMPHVDEPQIVDKALSECKEILDEVMEGKIQEWIN